MEHTAVELRAYGAIIWRRLWLVVLVVAIVGIYVAYQGYHLLKTPGALKAYHSSITVQVGLQPAPRGVALTYTDDMNVAEALADALPAVLTTPSFDSAVSQQIGQDMQQIQARFGNSADLGDWQNSGAIGSALSASRVHNLVTIDVAWSTAAGSWAIANATGEVLTSKLNTYLDYIIEGTAVVVNPSAETAAAQIQPEATGRLISSASDPVLGAGSAGNRVTLLLIILLIGLLIGLALAFLVDYLDDRIRTTEEVVQLLHLPVYGELPRPPRVGGEARVSRRLPPSSAA
jgi:capsular polysaccharide biosynthesis protein